MLAQIITDIQTRRHAMTELDDCIRLANKALREMQAGKVVATAEDTYEARRDALFGYRKLRAECEEALAKLEQSFRIHHEGAVKGNMRVISYGKRSAQIVVVANGRSYTRHCILKDGTYYGHPIEGQGVIGFYLEYKTGERAQ